jgi:hypothetical protein
MGCVHGLVGGVETLVRDLHSRRTIASGNR